MNASHVCILIFSWLTPLWIKTLGSVCRDSLSLCVPTSFGGQERGSKLLLFQICFAVENLFQDPGVKGKGHFQHLSAYFNSFNHWVFF